MVAALPDNSGLEQSAYRKASLRILPLIALGYGAAYIDRVNISFAALQMNRDLKFSATVYGLGAGLFFLSYAACEIPSNLLLCRFGARRWLARIMVTWVLPDGPETARWLTEPERNAILMRIPGRAAHALGGPSEPIGSALRDVRVWLLLVFMFCMLGSSYAYGFFAPAIVQKLSGLSITGTGFLMAAMYLLGAAAMLGNGILADRGRDPFRCVLPGCFMMSGGFLVLALSSVSLVALSGLLVIDLTGDNQRGLLTMAIPMLIAAGIMLHLRRQTHRALALPLASAAEPA